MKRNEHLFQFTGKQISEAAAAEAGYHTDRIAFWKAEQAAAIEKAKAAGVEVREYEVTGGKTVDVVLDLTITSQLSRSGSKIREHQNAADAFQIQAACYGTQADRTYELHPDDVIYFRLAGGPRVE